MGRRKKIIIAISVLFASLYLNAKEPPADLGYDPPEGWEFVMKLDSASGMFLHCHNDTCFNYTRFVGGKPFLYHLTTDGGETWEKIPVLPPNVIFKHNSNTLHRTILEDGYTYYQMSHDFFKTSEKHLIDKITNTNDTIYQSPLDPELLIATFRDGVTTPWYRNVTMIVYVSRDGGKTWSEMKNLPKQVQGLTVYYIAFDWAEQGHWFLNAKDGVDINQDLGKNLGTKHYETFDNGNTFREIKFDPISNSEKKVVTEIGIDGYKTFRELTKTYASGITKKKYNDTLQSSKFIDWLFIMDPNKPKSNVDSGYVRAIYDNYQFDFKDYYNQLTPLYEITDRLDENKEAINTYIYTSNNFGNNWLLLNEFYKKPRYINSFLDQGTKSIWIHVKDEPFNRETNNSYYKGSLWKLKLPWESTSVNDLGFHNSGMVIYPNPANDFITIQLSNKGLKPFVTSEKVQIFDVLGIERMSELIHPMTGSHRMNIEGISSGVYFIRIGNRVEKFVKIN